MTDQETIQQLQLILDEYRLRFTNMRAWMDAVIAANKAKIEEHQWKNWKAYYKGRVDAFELARDELRMFETCELS